MRVGIIGPGDVTRYSKEIGISREKYGGIIKKLVQILIRSGSEIVVTPDKGSCSELVALEYKKAGGKKVYIVAPLDDKEFGYEWINLGVGDKTINCGIWRNQPENFCENSGLLICIGWGGGTLVEIYYTRWFGKIKKIYVIEELIDSKLPESLLKSFKIIEYISINNLKIK
ncbi:hypothetical protein HZA33_02760 [Candidatus Pacearchaeota archaeon]|nr:hypothetical protein [Candidatus Pacearchaeota archaeon]